MGYESKLYIVEKRQRFESEEKRYARVIAMFDVCKFYDLSNKLRRCPKTDCFIYADDGDTEITEDKYGEELTEATPEFVVAALKKILETGEDYWVILPILSFLEALIDTIGENENIAVLHYGY